MNGVKPPFPLCLHGLLVAGILGPTEKGIHVCVCIFTAHFNYTIYNICCDYLWRYNLLICVVTEVLPITNCSLIGKK
jgi:hypothetical protein